MPAKIVLSRLSPELSAMVKSDGSGDLALPLKRILSQLPQGAVKLTFGEIRQAAPAGTFLDVTSQDQTYVDLPLPEILSRLSSNHLSRRPAQKTIEVPPEVGNVFGPRGEQLAQSSGDTTIRRASPAPAPTPKPEPAPVQAKAPTLPAPPSLPEPATAPAPAAAPQPEQKIAAPKLPLPGASPAPAAATAPIPAPKIPAPSLPKIEPAQPKPAIPAPALPKPVVPQPVVAKGPEVLGETLTVPLASLTEDWPQNVKEEISSGKLDDYSVGLPMDRIEAGLKTGKLSFSWKEIAGWLKPNPFTSQINAETSVDLPLKIVAPLFISQHRPAKTQKKLAIDETIPDLFAGGKGPAVAPVAQSTPAPAPTAAAPDVSAAPPAPALPKPTLPIPAANLPKPGAVPAPSLPKPPVPQPPKTSPTLPVPSAPAIAPAKEPQTLGELFGDANKKDWSPKEVVSKANTLKGIAGSLVVLQDGLMVAGELPAAFRVETTAAFVPQIFGRMMQYAKELNLGDLSSVTVECDKAPLQITKAGLIYFGVVGKAGEPLPVGQIKLIATELAKQNK